MIDRLIPKYPTFLVLGFLIMGFSLFFLTAGRDALIWVWADRFFDGNLDGTFEATQTADQVIGRIMSVLLFVGLGVIMLGIGSAIATIVRNLRATGRTMVDAYSEAGVAGAEDSRFEEPWFGRYFTRFLFGGMSVVLFFFVMSWCRGANLVFLKEKEFDGETSGAAYETFLTVDRILDPLIEAGKFLGVGLLIFGILIGLVTIIMHLSFQARAVPVLTRRALAGGNGDGERPETLRPHIPGGLVKLGIVGLVLMALAVPLAFIRAGFIGWVLDRQFDGSVSEWAIRAEGILARSIDPLINMGMGVLFFTIVFLLLAIIHWLREQRRGFGDAVADASGGAIARPVLEPTLWPHRLVAPLAVAGIIVVGFFFFSVTPLREVNFNNMLSLQFAGTTGSVLEDAVRVDRTLGPIIGAVRFIGIASLMTAIGLALVTIVINLRATALLLPAGFTKLISVAKGEQPEEEELTVDEPMSLAPWDLFRPHLAGVAIVVTATLPVAVLHAVFINVMLGEQFAGLDAAGAMSGLFQDSFLTVNLFGATQQPWMLFGMGLILFAIGRFFSTIVGFVEARRMIIEEGTTAIAELVVSGGPEPVESASRA